MQPLRPAPRWLVTVSRVCGGLLAVFAMVVVARLPGALADSSAYRAAAPCPPGSAVDTPGCVGHAQAVVLRRHYAGGRSTTYYLDLALAGRSFTNESVPYGVYRNTTPGAPVDVALWRGRVTYVSVAGAGGSTGDNPTSVAQLDVVIIALTGGAAALLLWWPSPVGRRLRTTARSGVPAEVHGASGLGATVFWTALVAGPGLTVAASLAIGASSTWPVAAVAGTLVAWGVLRWLRAYGLVLDAQGVTWRRPFLNPRRFSWDQVRGIGRFGVGRGRYWALDCGEERLRLWPLTFATAAAQPVLNEIRARC